MSWAVRIVPAPKTSEDFWALKIGDGWWLDPIPGDPNRWQALAPEHAGKRVFMLKLPCGTYFNVYGTTWSNGQPGPAGWKVSGAPPMLTLEPSVNIGGGWHGCVRDGLITDDVSGKAFA